MESWSIGIKSMVYDWCVLTYLKAFLLYSRAIDIHDKNGALVKQLREDVLIPKAQQFSVSVENELFFRVKLAKPPTDGNDKELPIDKNNNLIVFKQYQKGTNKNIHRPHRYPASAKKGKNLFLEPWKIDFQDLEVISGLKTLVFWMMIDRLYSGKSYFSGYYLYVTFFSKWGNSQCLQCFRYIYFHVLRFSLQKKIQIGV